MIEGYYNKLQGRLYEKGGAWEKFLETILLELYGLEKIDKTINYWPLIGKLSELKYLDYQYFRKTIFECINLVKELSANE